MTEPAPKHRVQKAPQGAISVPGAWGVKRLRALRAGSKDGDMFLPLLGQNSRVEITSSYERQRI